VHAELADALVGHSATASATVITNAWVVKPAIVLSACLCLFPCGLSGGGGGLALVFCLLVGWFGWVLSGELVRRSPPCVGFDPLAAGAVGRQRGCENWWMGLRVHTNVTRQTVLHTSTHDAQTTHTRCTHDAHTMHPSNLWLLGGWRAGWLAAKCQVPSQLPQSTDS
jgi:hypothetical protein